MKEVILIAVIAALAGCGGARGGTNLDTVGADTEVNSNSNTSKAATAMPAKTSAPFAVHPAPRLIELVKKYKDTINTDLAGRDIIVVGRAWDVASDGVYLNTTSEAIACLMPAEARADEKFDAARQRISSQPIVEVRGDFDSAEFYKSGSVYVRLKNCTILSLPNPSDYK